MWKIEQFFFRLLKRRNDVREMELEKSLNIISRAREEKKICEHQIALGMDSYLVRTLMKTYDDEIRYHNSRVVRFTQTI